MIKLALICAAAGVFLTGCETSTVAQKIEPGLWWVCDGSKDSSTCGANPEKGLNKTCFKEGRAIRAYRRVPGGALVVRCN